MKYLDRISRMIRMVTGIMVVIGIILWIILKVVGK